MSVSETLNVGLTTRRSVVLDDEASEAILPNSMDADRAPRLSIQEQVEEMKRLTLLDPGTVEQLQQDNPGLLAYLRSSTGLLLQVALFVTFIGIDTGKAIFGSVALKGTSTVSQSLVLSSNLLGVILGLAIAHQKLGMDGVRQCTDPKLVMKFAGVAIIFSLANCFGNLAYAFLSAGTVKIFGQLRLLQTAVLSTLFLKRRYIMPQWTAMIGIVLSALMFMQGKTMNKQMLAIRNHFAEAGLATSETCAVLLNGLVDSHEPDKVATACGDLVMTTSAKEEKMAIGIMCVLLFIFFSDVGSIISEKFLKDGSSTPFFVQKVAIDLTTSLTTLIMAFCMPWFLKLVTGDPAVYEKQMFWRGGFFGFFKGWGLPVLISVIFSTMQSWLSGLIVKQLSSVMKLLGKVVSLGCIYLLADCWLLKEGDGPPTVCTFAQSAAMLGTLTFLLIQAPKPS